MINDQLQECKSCFTGQKEPFIITFYLDQHELNRLLVIDVKNKMSPEYFQLKIDREYIQQKADLAFCFEQPQDLFYTLMQLFAETTFDGAGTLTFEMKLNATKLKKKVFKLVLIKYNMEEDQFMKIKLQSLSRDVKIEMQERQEKIKNLIKKSEEQEEAIVALKEEVKEMKKEQEALILQNKRQYFKIGSLSKENELQNAQILTLKKNLQFVLSKLNSLQFCSFVDNPHWNYFSVVKTEKNYRIIRKDNDGVWYTFVYNLPLSGEKINGFKIKQTKTYSQNVMVGIVTKEVFGKNYPFKDKESLAYNCYNGNIWENGISRRGGLSVYDGQVITMEVNLTTNKIAWFADNVRLAKSNIPEGIHKKQIFLALHFYNVEDQLQLLLF